MTLPPMRLPILERTQASEARRLASDVARSAGFSDTDVGEIAIVVTEAGNNLANHAAQGELLIMPFNIAGTPVLDILSVDHGPGMDLHRCLDDGFSTGGTAGQGLGAIRRLASEFTAYSSPRGTTLLARFIPKQSAITIPFVAGMVLLPKPGERACGDHIAIRQTPSGVAVLVADGLGHGEFAADASSEAANIFRSVNWISPAETIERLHGGLRGTRGSAVAIAEIDLNEQAILYSGLGNIAGVVYFPSGSQSLVSYNGTAGHHAAKIAQFRYPWPPGSTLIMHSDGIATQWNFDSDPAVRREHPVHMAAMLYRDFCRGRDDVSVVALTQTR